MNTATLAEQGFALVPQVVGPAEVGALSSALEHVAREGRGGVRNLLDHVAVRAWVSSLAVRALVEADLGPDARPVRAILFDKTPDANWKVSWHQDLSIAVLERVEHPGFGPWSLKDGVWHVQPPAEVLERMLAVRLHLDPCGAENGPVRVLPASHLNGKLREGEYAEWRERVKEVPCLAERGDVLLMKPLLLHASSPAAIPGHRRVLHVEYAAATLPGRLTWHWEGNGPGAT